MNTPDNLTLRDYFAAHALAGGNNSVTEAYDLADAMLEARKPKPKVLVSEEPVCFTTNIWLNHSSRRLVGEVTVPSPVVGGRESKYQLHVNDSTSHVELERRLQELGRDRCREAVVKALEADE
jgi:hypothetical protein